MSAIRPRAAAAASALAAVVAAGVLGPAPAQAATGPASADGGYAFTAKLEIGDGDTKRACTGALVEPQWVLTAASCFAADPQQGFGITAGKPQFKTLATIGRTDLSATGGHVSEIVDLVPRAGRDMVMARLAQPATGITPAKIAASPVAAGDTLTVAGYGRTKTEWVPGTLHTAAFTVSAVKEAGLDIAGKTANDAICMGDTGAPLLQVNNGTPELVAVAGRSWQGGCFGESETRTDAVAARADNITLGSRLPAGQRMLPGDTLTSASTRLTMQDDGNLVLTHAGGQTLWTSKSVGNKGATARLNDTGSLQVVAANNTTVLWETKTNAPGGSVVLTDRGNLVIQTSKNESVWSTNTARRHDYNGDGRDDMAWWNDFTTGTDATYTLLAKSDGSFSDPAKSFTAVAGQWDARYLKFATGDFNGDGRGDVAILRPEADTSARLFTALGQNGGGFAAPTASWTLPAGSMHASHLTPQAGDFNGDGRDDLALWYAHPDGTTKLVASLTNEQGGFTKPFDAWTAPKGSFVRDHIKFTTGDFNGDGRDDIGAFYRQGDDTIRAYTFLATPTGSFTNPTDWWTSTLKWAQATPQAGDFNGDGRDDLALWYDYNDGSDKVSTMLAESIPGKNRFGSAKLTLDSKPGNWDITKSQLLTGDFNGDGRDDLAALRLNNNTIQTYTWTAAENTMFNVGRPGWNAPTTSWPYNPITLLTPYNN
ncbi:FG-GAP-like repeat-containing protein [Streptomyces sp. NPDC005279]|uniref:FG-GAP-like repeat-containing protein n=1 Tax=Streptomyces sp. NPDC005279 TaxID=3364712 RepID=UPI00367F3E77